MRRSTNLYGVPIDIVTMDSAIERGKNLIESKGFSMICTPNTEILMQAKDNDDLKQILKTSDMNIPDGIGLVIASKIHKLGLIEKVAGVDLMKEMLNYCNLTKKSVYLLGGDEESAVGAVETIKSEYKTIRIAGYHNGYFKDVDTDRIIADINKVKPDFLMVGLGAPKQEKWMYDNRSKLDVKLGIGIGGGIDILSGKAKRSPQIFINLGLEWFYRLMKQPQRIGRMLILPKFLFKVMTSKEIAK